MAYEDSRVGLWRGPDSSHSFLPAPAPPSPRAAGGLGLQAGSPRWPRQTDQSLPNSTLLLDPCGYSLPGLTAFSGSSCIRREHYLTPPTRRDIFGQRMSAEIDVYLVLYNYETHKTKLIQAWLVKRPRFHLHFTPISAS